jgi:threonine dehydrogenase-like Zn-dependent dehydrogenase
VNITKVTFPKKLLLNKYMENQTTLTEQTPHLSRPKPALMKAAVITSPRNIEFMDIPVPSPGENQVLIRIEGCGICGSDLPVWEGREWFKYPYSAGAPGHEGFGIVEEVGSNVSSVSVGERVAMLSYHAYAEYDIAEADQVVKLPGKFDNLPFPGEPLGCGMNIFKRAQITSADTVAIVGAGFLGNLLIQLCKSVGAKVIAVSRRESSLKMAFECGVDHIVRLDDHYQVLQKVKELTNNEGCTRVIEATGKQWPLDIAGEIVGVRGLLIIAGFHQDGLRQVNVQNWNWKGIDVINAHERDWHQYINGMQLAIDAVSNGTLNPLPLFTHRYDFAQLNLAFKKMSEGVDGYVKGIVKMNKL